MKDKISIIIPVYNVEKYIDNCLKSVLNQTYNELEILLINDGSKDKSKNICLKYGKIDNRIKFIDKNHVGISECRNIGIKMATGKYIAFVDSDDYVKKDMIEKLYNTIIKFSCDIAMCKFKRTDSVNEDCMVNKDKDLHTLVTTFSGDEKYELIYNENENVRLDSVIIWNKLYNKNVFKNVKYPKGKIHEDEMVIHKIFDNTNAVAYVDEVLYYYLKRPGSITTKKYYLKRQDLLIALEDRYEFFIKNGKEKYAGLALKEYYMFIIKHYYKVKQLKYDRKYCKALISQTKLRLKTVMKNKYIKLRFKLLIFIFYLFPNIITSIISQFIKLDI